MFQQVNASGWMDRKLWWYYWHWYTTMTNMYRLLLYVLVSKGLAYLRMSNVWKTPPSTITGAVVG